MAITIDEAARVVAIRKIDDFAPAESRVERDAGSLRKLYEAQKAIGAADDLHDVVIAIADACLGLVPQATHVTVVLRDDDEDGGRAGVAGYVPIATRVRGRRSRRATWRRYRSRGASSGRS